MRLRDKKLRICYGLIVESRTDWDYFEEMVEEFLQDRCGFEIDGSSCNEGDYFLLLLPRTEKEEKELPRLMFELRDSLIESIQDLEAGVDWDEVERKSSPNYGMTWGPL